MGIKPEDIGRMTLSEFNLMYEGFAQFNGGEQEKPEEKPRTKKQLEEAYKALGIYYPEIFEDLEKEE